MLERQEQDKKEEALLKDLKGKESVTVDGRKIKIYANIGGPEDVEAVLENDAEGVGLFRSEFVYLNTKGNPPSEEEQFNAYKEVLEALAPRKVVIRTCDIGADKQVGYMNLDQEANPCHGIQGYPDLPDKEGLFQNSAESPSQGFCLWQPCSDVPYDNQRAGTGFCQGADG